MEENSTNYQYPTINQEKSRYPDFLIIIGALLFVVSFSAIVIKNVVSAREKKSNDIIKQDMNTTVEDISSPTPSPTPIAEDEKEIGGKEGPGFFEITQTPQP